MKHNQKIRGSLSAASSKAIFAPLFVRGMVSMVLCGPLWAGEAPTFGPGVQVGTVEHSSLTEISGIAASRQNLDVLWAHNDSGGEARVYAMNTAGTHLGIFNLTGAQAVDYEDMAIGPGPSAGIDYLFVADTGNNNLSRTTVTVYRTPEPAVAADQSPVTVDLTEVDALSMSYPGQTYDSETLLVDPLSGDLYLVTRDRDSASGDTSLVFRNPAPHLPGVTVTLELVTSFPAPVEIKGGDVSPDGSEILLRPHSNNDPVDALWWPWAPGTSLADVFAQPGCPVPAVFEPQGEAIAFAGDGLSYYTISEGSNQPVYHYTIQSGPGPLFADGFESGGFEAGAWAVVSPASVTSGAAYAGNFGALVKKSGSLSNAVEVTGQDLITMSYARRTSGLGAGEFLLVEHSSDGANWATLEQIGGSSDWAPSSFQIPVASAVFHFRFRLTGSSGKDVAMIDEVQIIGAAGGTNFAPVAHDDAYSMESDTILTVSAPGVLANDTDANGDLLTAGHVSGPSSGTLSLAADGSFTYTPSAGFEGTDSFAYAADDGNGGSDTATVVITVEPPVGEPVSVHVESIVVGTIGLGKGNKAGSAEVVVLDNNGDPVPGAVVQGSFSEDLNEAVAATTDGSGTAVLTTTATARGGVRLTFCVTSVTAGGLTYDSAANVETCDQNY